MGEESVESKQRRRKKNSLEKGMKDAELGGAELGRKGEAAVGRKGPDIEGLKGEGRKRGCKKGKTLPPSPWDALGVPGDRSMLPSKFPPAEGKD